MAKILNVCLAFILISNYAASQYTLEIEIQQIKNNTGKIMLQLFDENHTVLAQEMSEIKEYRCSFHLKNLGKGKYAVRYFHDENLNGKLDTNMIGIPTEGYGFSNNVTGKFGPPSFEKWLFEISSDKKITLIPTY